MLKRIFAKVADIKLQNFFSKLKQPDFVVINDLDQITDPNQLPVEMQYVLMVRPSRYSRIRQLIQAGYGLVVVKEKQLPAELLRAVQRIAMTQEYTLFPWLEHALLREQRPHWLESDQEDANNKGYSLDDELNIILQHKKEFNHFAIINAQQEFVSNHDLEFLQELNQEIFGIHAPFLAHRIAFVNAFNFQYLWKLLLATLLIAAPLAYFLEFIFPGLGKAILPLIYGSFLEIKNYINKYQLGYSAWQLRSAIIRNMPWYFMVIGSAVMIQIFYYYGSYHLSALFFTLTLLLLPIVLKTKDLIKTKSNFIRLVSMGKIDPSLLSRWPLAKDGNTWWLEYFAYAITCVFILTLISLSPKLFNSGVAIALLSASPYLILFCVIQIKDALRIHEFKSQVKQALKQTIVSFER